MALGATAVASVATGCIEERPPLRLRALEVIHEVDGVFDDSLELEVHAFDADEGTFLGCARAREAVASDVRYAMNHAFLRGSTDLEDRELLRDEELVGRSVVLVVAEIDDPSGQGRGCPLLYDVDDDIVGVSAVISEESMMSGVSLVFDRVASLSVGVAP